MSLFYFPALYQKHPEPKVSLGYEVITQTNLEISERGVLFSCINN